MATVKLGLIVSPAIDQLEADELAAELGEALDERYSEVDWEIESLIDPLAEPPIDPTELVGATRERLLAADWDLAVAITELPLRLSHRPLLSHASRTHSVGLVSMPALGVLKRRRRLYDVVAETVGTLLGDPPHDRAKSAARRLGVGRRLAELAGDVGDDGDGGGVIYVSRVLSGNLRLLVGMVGSNHPWRLVGRLWRAMLGAAAAGAFALIDLGVWKLTATLGVGGLALPALAAIAAASATLILGHGLWERAPATRVREQVTMFNLATAATVVFGISALYLFVLMASLLAAVVLIQPSLFATTVGHDVNGWDYVRLAWFASAMGTIGGALGATLETDQAVREAAYTNHAVDENSSMPRPG